MCQVLLDAFGRPIFGYWFFYGLGLLAAVCVFLLLASRRGLGFLNAWAILALSILGAFLLGRLGHILFEPGFGDWTDLQTGGEVSFTGMAGALLLPLIFAWWRKLPLGDVLDAGAPAIFLAQGIQRLGCFCNGCCYGPTADTFLSVRFPSGSVCFREHLAWGWVGPQEAFTRPVVPMQLIEFSVCLAVAGVAGWLVWRARLGGRAVWLAFVFYGGCRFILQWFRPNYDLDNRTWGWNSGHTMALIMLAAGAGMVWLIHRFPRLGIARTGNPGPAGKPGTPAKPERPVRGGR